MKERSEEVAVVYNNGQLDKNVFVCEFCLLHAAAKILASPRIRSERQAHFSVVNLPSLYAVMKFGDSLNARKLNAPCELRLTSCTSATVLSLTSF